MRFKAKIRSLKDQAMLSMENKLYTHAINTLYQILGEGHNDVWVRQKVAECYERLGKFEEAAVEFRRVADVYYQRNDFRKALALYKVAGALNPKSSEILFSIKEAEERLSIERSTPKSPTISEPFDIASLGNQIEFK